MTTIAIRIPLGETPLLFVRGNCTAFGFEDFILAKSMNYNVEVESTLQHDGRRVIHAPSFKPFEITRQVDIASSYFTQSVVTSRIAPYPWEIYFLRSVDGFLGLQLFMTVFLTGVLVKNYSVNVADTEMTETLTVSPTIASWKYMFYDSFNAPRGIFSYSFNMQTGEYL